MSDASSFFQAYGLMKYYIMVFIITLICFSTCICSLMALRDNYQLSTNSKISYKLTGPNNEILDQDCELTIPNCKIISEYDVNSEHYKNIEINNNNKLKVGPTKIYYKNADHKSYAISDVSPPIIPSVVTCILFIIICIIFVLIHFMKTNKTFGAVIGATSAAGDLSRAFRIGRR